MLTRATRYIVQIPSIKHCINPGSPYRSCIYSPKKVLIPKLDPICPRLSILIRVGGVVIVVAVPLAQPSRQHEHTPRTERFLYPAVCTQMWSYFRPSFYSAIQHRPPATTASQQQQYARKNLVFVALCTMSRHSIFSVTLTTYYYLCQEYIPHYIQIVSPVKRACTQRALSAPLPLSQHAPRRRASILVDGGINPAVQQWWWWW